MNEIPQVKSLLIIHQGALGDFILALPALETLREAFPKVKTVIMGYPRILELVNQRHYADEIHSIDQSGMASFFIQGRDLDHNLSGFFKSFDLIVVFAKDDDEPIVENLKNVCKGLFFHIPTFPKREERIHLTYHLLRGLSEYGFPMLEQKPRLYLDGSDRYWGRDFWKRKNLNDEDKKRVVVIHPGSGSNRKVWILEGFVDLVRYLHKNLNSKIFIIIGPAEGTDIRKIFKGMEGNGIVLAEGLSLIQLASAMEGCRLFIGNDSGISHMAAALGIPTIAIFGPTDPEVWSPKGDQVLIVRKEMPCSPCSRERLYQCKNFECLKEIEIEDIIKSMKRIGMG